jgi:hypothetical protein
MSDPKLKQSKEELIQGWYDGEITFQEIKELEQQAVKDQGYEIAEVVKEVIDIINKIN